MKKATHTKCAAALTLAFSLSFFMPAFAFLEIDTCESGCQLERLSCSDPNNDSESDPDSTTDPLFCILSYNLCVDRC